MLHPEAGSSGVLISSTSRVAIANLCPVATQVKRIEGTVIVVDYYSSTIRVGILHMVYEYDAAAIGHRVSAEVAGSKAIIASQEHVDVGRPIACRQLLSVDESGRDCSHRVNRLLPKCYQRYAPMPLPQCSKSLAKACDSR